MEFAAPTEHNFSSKDKNKEHGQLVVQMTNRNKENYFNVLTSCSKHCFAKF
jgi:hypothetical protein